MHPLSRRNRSYLASRLWADRARNILRALHQGFWLGFLDRRHLEQLTAHYYADPQARSTSEAYQGREYNLSGLQQFEETAYDEYFVQAKTLLIGAVGGGRELIALLPRCDSIDAFESNSALLSSCRELLQVEGLEARVVSARPGRVPRELDTYDAAICGWGAYMHVAGRRHRIRFLSEFRDHLRPEGFLLLSFFTRQDSRSQRLAIGIARGLRRFRRAEAPEAGDRIAGSFDHHFTETEIRNELLEAGFAPVLYSERPYGHAVGRALRAAASRDSSEGQEDAATPASSPSLRVRGYIRTRDWVEGLVSVLKAVHQGLWLGLLDRSSQSELTSYYYSSADKSARSVDYSDAKFNLQGLWPWETAALDGYFASCQSILVASAGGGREALALSVRFPRIEAFECNPQLFESLKTLARKQDGKIRTFAAMPDSVPSGLGRHDGAVLGWCAYIHILGRLQRVRFLKRLHRHLEPGAPLLLSFVQRDQRTFGGVVHLLARVIRFARRAQPPERGEFVERASGRYFTEREIRDELGEAGFETAFYSEFECPHVVARAAGRAGHFRPSGDGLRGERGSPGRGAAPRGV